MEGIVLSKRNNQMKGDTMNLHALVVAMTTSLVLWPTVALAAPFDFSTGSPDGLMATASRPDSPGKIEIESADDFILASQTRIDHATFTGLLPSGTPLSNVGAVGVEIYRVFPKDSDTVRTAQVPTRANSPSDVAFTSRDSATAGLGFTVSLLNSSFTTANSVLNGIHPFPSQTTDGEGPVTGQEVQFNVDFLTPLNLPADHYFFIPQVQLATGDFLWLSAPKPTVPPFAPDLQTWIRNANLAPDWLRVGTDIVGKGAFNGTFSLSGETVAVPLPGAVVLAGLGLLLAARRREYE